MGPLKVLLKHTIHILTPYIWGKLFWLKIYMYYIETYKRKVSLLKFELTRGCCFSVIKKGDHYCFRGSTFKSCRTHTSNSYWLE